MVKIIIKKNKNILCFFFFASPNNLILLSFSIKLQYIILLDRLYIFITYLWLYINNIFYVYSVLENNVHIIFAVYIGPYFIIKNLK